MASSITKPWWDGLALVLLLFGGFLFGIGWIFGLTLLWTSPSWTRQEKRLGSIVPLLELALFAVLVIFTSGSSASAVGSAAASPAFTVGDGIAWAAIAVLCVAPIGITVWLATRLGRNS
jgi:hypothetical protein